MICLDSLPFNLHCRYNLTQASNICKAAPRSLLWSPSGLNELLKEGFELLFNLIAKSTMAFLTGQPQHVLKSCLGHQNKGLALAHRLTLPDVQFHLWCKLNLPTYTFQPWMDPKALFSLQILQSALETPNHDITDNSLLNWCPFISFNCSYLPWRFCSVSIFLDCKFILPASLPPPYLRRYANVFF